MKIVCVGLICGLVGFCAAHQIWYYREAREILRRAGEIEGVDVLMVEGNHDSTLEDIWLDLRFQGERIRFANLSLGSFDDVAHLAVGQVGEWEFVIREFEAGVSPPADADDRDPDAEPICYAWGAHLDFGRAGDVGTRLDPHIRSIPAFLQRLPEVRALVESLPDRPPGGRVGEGEYRFVVTQTGETKTIPTWIWAYRIPAAE